MRFLRTLCLGLVCGVLSSPHDITESHLDDLVDGLRSDAFQREVRSDDEVMMRTIPQRITPFIQSEPYNETLAHKALNFAYLSYCSSDCIDTSSCRWSPPKDDNALESFTVVDDADSKTAALVGYAADEDMIVVAFRGTHNLRNWLLDLDFDHCVPKFATKIIESRKSAASSAAPTVHCGFLAGYTILREGVIDAIQDLLSRHARASLLVTGHSLGGAMANLAAVELSQLANPALASLFKGHRRSSVLAPSVTRLYTFGAPRTGDDTFAEFAHEHKGLAASYRIVNSKDPVPHLPFTSWSYHHIGSEVWYTDSAPQSATTNRGTKGLLSSPYVIKDALPSQKYSVDQPDKKLYPRRKMPSAEELNNMLLEEQRSSAPTDLYVSCDGSGEDELCSNEVALWDAMLHAYDHLMYFGLREKC